jgi:hypothetical protein
MHNNLEFQGQLQVYKKKYYISILNDSDDDTVHLIWLCFRVLPIA